MALPDRFEANVGPAVVPARVADERGVLRVLFELVVPIENVSYRVASVKKPYSSPDELQADLGARLKYYNEGRPHPGRHCRGETPVQTRRDAKPLVGGQMPGRQHQPVGVHYDGQPAAA